MCFSFYVSSFKNKPEFWQVSLVLVLQVVANLTIRPDSVALTVTLTEIELEYKDFKRSSILNQDSWSMRPNIFSKFWQELHCRRRVARPNQMFSISKQLTALHSLHCDRSLCSRPFGGLLKQLESATCFPPKVFTHTFLQGNMI